MSLFHHCKNSLLFVGSLVLIFHFSSEASTMYIYEQGISWFISDDDILKKKQVFFDSWDFLVQTLLEILSYFIKLLIICLETLYLSLKAKFLDKEMIICFLSVTAILVIFLLSWGLFFILILFFFLVIDPFSWFW